MYGLSNYDDLDGIASPEMLKDALIAAGTAGVSLIVSFKVVSMIPVPSSLSEAGRTWYAVGVQGLAGLIMGRALWNVNRSAALGAVAGGFALAPAALLGVAIK